MRGAVASTIRNMYVQNQEIKQVRLREEGSPARIGVAQGGPLGLEIDVSIPRTADTFSKHPETPTILRNVLNIFIVLHHSEEWSLCCLCG